MFGSVSQWLISALGGIRVAPDAFGADRLLIAPRTVSPLASVNATYNSVRGAVTVQWQCNWNTNECVCAVRTPPNVLAVVQPPPNAAAVRCSAGCSGWEQRLQAAAGDAVEFVGNGMLELYWKS